MIEAYFSKLPVINYNDRQARNLSERVTIVTKNKIAPFDFFPYELSHGLRADQLAGAYYDDPNLDWMIYLTNDIVDPYYGWHLYELDFNEYILQKYGTLDFAQQKIAFWRTNWPSDTQEVTQTYFDNLPDGFKKYYQPVWGRKASILSYKRRQDDTQTNTNKIIQYEVTYSGNSTPFANNDLIVFGVDEGSGECIYANSTHIVAKDLRDTYTLGPIKQRSNTNNQAVIVSMTTLSTNIPTSEADFWEPVSYWDVEYEKNENKRFIDVIGKNLVFDTAETVRKAFLVT